MGTAGVFSIVELYSFLSSTVLVGRETRYEGEGDGMAREMMGGPSLSRRKL
jgi:hypothetical protein